MASKINMPTFYVTGFPEEFEEKEFKGKNGRNKWLLIDLIDKTIRDENEERALAMEDTTN